MIHHVFSRVSLKEQFPLCRAKGQAESGHASWWSEGAGPLGRWLGELQAGSLEYGKIWKAVQCGAPKIAKLDKLVYNSKNYGLWMFMELITIVTGVNGVYKPTYNWGVPHCKRCEKLWKGMVKRFNPNPYCLYHLVIKHGLENLPFSSLIFMDFPHNTIHFVGALSSHRLTTVDIPVKTPKWQPFPPSQAVQWLVTGENNWPNHWWNT